MLSKLIWVCFKIGTHRLDGVAFGVLVAQSKKGFLKRQQHISPRRFCADYRGAPWKSPSSRHAPTHFDVFSAKTFRVHIKVRTMVKCPAFLMGIKSQVGCYIVQHCKGSSGKHKLKLCVLRKTWMRLVWIHPCRILKDYQVSTKKY